MANRLGLICFLWICTVLAVPALAVRMENDPKLFTPTNEVVTPHIAWLRPAAQARLKILFITLHYNMREAIELTQRLEADCAVFAMAPEGGKFYFKVPFVTAQDREADLARQLQADYDVIVMNYVPWSNLPLHIRYLILKKVKAGAALFGKIIFPDEYLTRAMRARIQPDCSFLVPFKALPAYCANPDFKALLASTVDAAQFGKGRIVLLKETRFPQMPSMIPPSPDNPLDLQPLEYDYYWAYMIHLIEYAAGRGLQPAISGLDLIRATNNLPPPVAFTLAGPAPRGSVAWFTLRDPDNRVLVERRTPLAAAATNSVLFEVGHLPAGRYFADLRVTANDRILNFGSSFLEVSAETGIEKIEMKSDFRGEETLTGRVILSGAPAGSNLMLDVVWRDNYARLIARQTLPAAGQKHVGFQFPAAAPLSIIQQVEAELRRGSQVLDKRRARFSISNLYPPDDFRIIVWGHPGRNAYLCRYVAEALRRGGFDSTITEFSEALPLANLWHIPYATRLSDEKTDRATRGRVARRTRDDHVRVPCLTDPAYLEKEREKLVRAAEKVRPYSSLEFSLGDECHFVYGAYELCFSPTCVAAFRKFLAREYSTIAAMNREYASAFKSFDEVQPVTFDAARADARLVPLWVDYRRHMESVWADFHLRAQDWIRSVVPEAKVGHEGTENNNSIGSLEAYDFDKIMQAMLLNCTYESLFVPYAVGDLRRPGTLFSPAWFGSYLHLHPEYSGSGYQDWRAEAFLRYSAWRQLFRGANSLWIWAAAMNCDAGSVLAPDLSYYDYFKPLIAEFAELKRGIGKLFAAAQRGAGGVAILYSASSVHASMFTQPEGLTSIARTLNNLAPLFEDIACPFRVVSCRQVAEGILDAGEFPVLWLPLCQAVSAQEARAIKRFAENGGTVIADLRPAVCDEHGKPYARGALDDVFGIARSNSAVVIVNGKVCLNDPAFPKSYPPTIGDGAVRTTTGQARGAIGQSPALVVNPCGKGKGILLNFAVANYCEGRVHGYDPFSGNPLFADAPAVRAFLRALLEYAGYAGIVRISPDVPGLRAYRFRNGPLEYIGLLRELPGNAESYYLYDPDQGPPPAVPVTLALGRRAHVYDLRQGRYLGLQHSVDVAVKPGEAQAFSLLPYRVAGLRVSLPSSIRPGETLKYQVRLAADGPADIGLHVYHVQFIDPKGQAAQYYTANLAADKGLGNGAIQLALDEKPGTWELRVRDAATGTTAAGKFKVRAK